MKKVFLAIGACALVFAGCKEHDIPLDFTHSGGVSGGTDSTYLLPTGSIPAPEAHNVLIEEFTGQSCSNCPAAHTLLQGLEGGGNVNVISLYITNFSQTAPPTGSVYDFRNTTASAIGASGIYGGISALPEGGVDRVPVAGTRVLYSGAWTSASNTQKLLTDSVNLKIESSFSGGTAKITATVTYLKDMSSKQNLSIVIVEDGMVGIQETPTVNDNAYVFSNVFRDMVTAAPLGDAILDTMATKKAGRVFVRKYTYTPTVVTPAVVPANCHVIAFVNAPGGTGDDYHILQSQKVKLVP